MCMDIFPAYMCICYICVCMYVHICSVYLYVLHICMHVCVHVFRVYICVLYVHVWPENLNLGTPPPYECWRKVDTRWH